MGAASHTFRAEVWVHHGDAAWHFVTLPEDLADEIEAGSAQQARGFGSVPVRVTLGGSVWETSLFPDTKLSSYVLPVKAAVRRAEGIAAGDTVTITVEPRA